MSYILDALKKSDRERQRGNVPGLDSIHDPHPASADNHSTRQRAKYITVAGFILLACGAAITKYWITHSTRANIPVAIEQAKTTSEPAKTTVSIPTIESPVENATRDLPPPPVITNHSKKIILLPEQTSPQQEEEVEVPPPDRKHTDIPDIKNLPPSIQADIPDLYLAGHTYSDNPTKRMIIINNDILREGDRVNDSITLIEITWTGVILDYNGKRFSMSIK